MRTITNTDLAVTNSAKCDATKTLFTAEQLGQFATEFVVTIDAKESGESGTGGEMGGEAGNEGRARGKPLPASRNNEEIESARLETRSRQNGKQQISTTNAKKTTAPSQTVKKQAPTKEANEENGQKSEATKRDPKKVDPEKRESGTPSTDSPVAQFVSRLIDTAFQQRASDIHIEPFEQGYRIRLRIDGLLQPGPVPPKEIAGKLSSRIKVLGQLDISERRLPQDGRLRLDTVFHTALDLRISSLPTLWGEKIVLRLLNVDTSHRGIEHLGLEQEQKAILQRLLRQPQGLILVTGPTGSGKTMTLYSALDLLNENQRNISTVEDPVEIDVHGINQVNVNPRIGLDFATTLRALLRQDPDVIMVGEIRDLETANIAIRAAQTGHLVLSTLHTNSAFATLERLIQMGIPRHNLTTSISLIMAQRLLRKLCIHCKKIDNLPTTILLEAGINQDSLNNTLFKAHQEGCYYCHQGYQGRLGIFELIQMDQKTLQLLEHGAEEISSITSRLQNNALRKAALEKVIQGITSLQEANRLTLMEESTL
jgi:type IV pilus assembly protein PilB